MSFGGHQEKKGQQNRQLYVYYCHGNSNSGACICAWFHCHCQVKSLGLDAVVIETTVVFYTCTQWSMVREASCYWQQTCHVAWQWQWWTKHVSKVS